MLADNQGNNHAVQRQGFRKDQHDEHTDKKFVLRRGKE
jgi:hypothetical protein